MGVDTQARNRIFVLVAFVSASMLILVAQLVRWQVVLRPHLVRQAAVEHRVTQPKTVPARRGSIYDRNGFLLATDVLLYDVSVSPEKMKDRDRKLAIELLSPLFDLDENDLFQALGEDQPWTRIRGDASQQQGEAIVEVMRNSWINGLNPDPYIHRVYPGGVLASHVVGFVNLDGQANYGVEDFYNSVLSGTVGTRRGTLDLLGNVVPISEAEYEPPQSGKNLYLTIDRTAQYVVETALAQAVKESRAEGGTVVVLHPRTGAILAMASLPAYDPNEYGKAFVDNPGVFMDPAISHQYEPGSVFKIFTLAAALDAGVITPDSSVSDFGQIEVGGQTIYNWDRAAHGTVDMVTVLAKSLNVGSAQVAVHLGKDRFYNYMRSFGFGSMTGVDLSGETGGRLKNPQDADWYESDLGTNSFGQGVATTPLQIAAAVAAVANDGFLMKPYVVQRVEVADDGWLEWREAQHQPVGEKVRYAQPQMMRPVIAPETAHTMTQMMVQAVERETVDAEVPGYRVAGKTGTAQIPVPGGYDPEDTIASFVGYLPADDPALVILVIINRPKTSEWGGTVAAPAFAAIAQQLATVFDIPPDDIRHQIASQHIGLVVQ